MDRTEPAQKGKKGGEASSEYLLVFIIADSILQLVWLGGLGGWTGDKNHPDC